ncbi:Integral membrane protein [Streptococcus sp. DD10]|uniref:DUF1129 domain-containing protein n=1 Tax=Streptococcus sp. DD10 TaxID=1777878 RepID=UPI00079B689B|nr:DUF1129 family protein [Streptococcus sp. DD10]KXT72588.1 Integral membrane protein [Streptococcus sp. DD10]
MSFSLDKLTHKNQEFIHIATNQFIADGKTDAEIKGYIEEIYPILLENQTKGITARSLFGSPTSWAKSKTLSPEQVAMQTSQENDDPKLMILDQILLVFGFFALINGLMGLFSSTSQSHGFLTILLTSIVGGFAFYAMYHFFYRHERTQRPGLLRSLLLIVGVTAAWLAVFSLAYLIPTAINPVFPDFILVILGSVALVGRHFFRKHFNIKNAMRA